MTQDKARKKAVRARAAATGESYTRAARQTQAAPPSASTAPPVIMPVPVALMVARHLRAARLHLGAGTGLLAEHADELPAVLDQVENAAFASLWDLSMWAEATAAASGVVDVAPGAFPQTDAQRAAQEALYPAEPRWCQARGRTLPQPGERLGSAPSPGVRYSLPGPVPDKPLVATASGPVVRASDVVPGTPAEPIWRAHTRLAAYVSDWAARGADSPADLAAAADGLVELAAAFQSAAVAILREVEDRASEGSLTGVDPDRLSTARASVERLTRPHDADGASTSVYAAMQDLRGALRGARAAVAHDDEGPRPSSRSMVGMNVVELRRELAAEVFHQRKRSRTREPRHARAEALRRMIQWCQATGRDTYDPHAHARAQTMPVTGTGAREGDDRP